MLKAKSIKDHLKEMAKEHGGDHYHVHGHDNGFTTHMVSEEGKAEGPMEHKAIGSVKRDMTESMDDDSEEETLP